MTYIKELQKIIEGHEDYEANLSAELSLAENELKDTLAPSITVMKQSQLILEMLMLNNEFMQKNKSSVKGKESKERLLELLDLNTKLHSVSDQNTTLKNMNRNLLGENQKLNRLVEKMKCELERVKLAEAF